MARDARSAATAAANARFKDRVRQWREEEILRAVGALLVKDGCLNVTMDDVARRVGIAKGSLYLHTASREELIGQLLDAWLAAVPVRPMPAAASDDDRWSAACAALFEPGERERPLAFPCCLQVSPCPNGWAGRWRAIAGAVGLRADDPSVAVAGEAVQALCAMPALRQLVAAGQLEAAQETLMRFLRGYLQTATGRSRVATRRAP